jgi:hypothetical protein
MSTWKPAAASACSGPQVCATASATTSSAAQPETREPYSTCGGVLDLPPTSISLQRARGRGQLSVRQRHRICEPKRLRYRILHVLPARTHLGLSGRCEIRWLVVGVGFAAFGNG